MAAGGRAPINVKSRLLKFGVFLFVWALIIVVRLTLLQVVHYGVWVQRAQRQQQRTVEVSPQRGIIYDRNGQELAMTVQVDSVFAVPSEIPDQKNTATILPPRRWPNWPARPACRWWNQKTSPKPPGAASSL